MIECLIELIGTFIFLSVIINSGKMEPTIAPIAIGLTLTAMIFFGGKISGGHFNPAVTTMFLLDNKITPMKAGGHIIAQLLGGLGAFLFFKNMKKMK